MTHIVSNVDGRAAADARQRFADDVQYYLAQDPRQLPSRYLYDALGSALFEAICELPWYGLTRAEERLLTAHGAEVLERAGASVLVELGPGSGDKMTRLLAAARERRANTRVHLIDISGSALARAVRAIESAGDVHVSTHETTYEEGLASFRDRRGHDERALVLFLGSNIGNFDEPGREAFLRAIRRALRRGDSLLLGADLVRPAADLLRAYDDPLGVTAAFNRNLLVRLNRELGGDIDLAAFVHRAVWNDRQSRIEMHLVSQRRQRLRLPAARLDFEMMEGDTIWTESSYKHSPEGIEQLLVTCGFAVRAQWIDQADRFALTQAEAV